MYMFVFPTANYTHTHTRVYIIFEITRTVRVLRIYPSVFPYPALIFFFFCPLALSDYFIYEQFFRPDD